MGIYARIFVNKEIKNWTGIKFGKNKINID